MSVVTSVDPPGTRIHLRMTDGVLDLVHFPRPDDPAALRPILQEALSALLDDHRQDVLTTALDLVRADAPPPSEHERAVTDRIQELLDEAGALPLPHRGDDFPHRADGRDPSGQVHVSLTLDRVVILDVPDHLLANPVAGGAAIRDATNLALMRLEGDLDEWIDRHPLPPREALVEPDWEATHLRLRRLAHGYW